VIEQTAREVRVRESQRARELNGDVNLFCLCCTRSLSLEDLKGNFIPYYE
jgi:hypothetical protein